MATKTKIILLALVTLGLFSGAKISLAAYGGNNSGGGYAGGNNEFIYRFVVPLSDFSYQLYRVESSTSSTEHEGDVAIEACINDTGEWGAGLCYTLNFGSAFGGQILGSADIPSEANDAFHYAVFQVRGRDYQTMNSFAVYGRKVSIDSFNSSESTVQVGAPFDVSWGTDLAFDGVNLFGPGYCPGTGAVGISGSITCTPTSAGTAELTLSAYGPGTSPVEQTITVNVLPAAKGTINVGTNLPNGAWSLSGAEAFSGSGIASSVAANAGTYTITPTHIDGYNESITSEPTQTLASGSTINFNIHYSAYSESSVGCSPNSQSISPEGTASFTAGGGSGAFSWIAPDANPSSGGNSSSFSASYAVSGDYTVTVTRGSSVDTCAVTVTPNPPPPPTPGNKTLTVSKIGNGTGTVTSSPAGINCGATCTNNFPNSQMVTLTATPSPGSTFIGWSGHCSGLSCSFQMSSDKSVTATFQTVFGYLDDVNCSIIGGWVFDPATPNSPATVKIFDGQLGSGSETLLYTDETPGLREDVNAAYNITGNHGFTITTPGSLFDSQVHSIYAYGVDSMGNNIQLYASPKNMQCSSPPTCSSVSPVGATVADNSTQRAYAYGVTSTTTLYFATWSADNGQDDLVWYEGNNGGSGTWYYDIDMSDHPGYGTVFSDVYMSNGLYTTVYCGGVNFNKVPASGITFTITYEPVAPSAPVISSISNQPCGTLTVNWTYNGADAQSFTVLRSATSGSGFAVIASNLAAAARSYIDTTAPADATSYYQVRVVTATAARTSTEASGFNVAALANLQNSSLTLYRVNGSAFNPSGTLADGDVLTFQIAVANNGCADANVTNITDTLSDNLSDPRNLLVDKGAGFVAGTISGTLPTITLNISGVKPPGNPNWVARFDATLTVDSGGSLEPLTSSGAINYTDALGVHVQPLNFSSLLISNDGTKVPDWREVAP